ncbi:MAG: thiamine pyrophosphate-dependent enzyme, partial [Holophagales bacterium]|nr:thiamine pyrophosphate-dependent enzyme [Holophagales bacterium]
SGRGPMLRRGQLMRSLAERKRAALHVETLEEDGARSILPRILPEAPASEPLEDSRRDEQRSHALREVTTVQALVEHLADLGVTKAFGVSGGAIALLFDALADGAIDLHHFRHETGAAFAACEASLATGRAVVIFATTGPGLLNALTGITAAKWDGAKVILISGSTSPAQRGRWATQETSPYTLPQDALYGKGSIFDFAARMEHVSEFPEVCRRLAQGVGRPGGFVAHISLPMAVQSGRVQTAPRRAFGRTIPAAAPEDVAEIARLLKGSSFVIWAGFGSTRAAPQVRALAERTGAKVMCSPRAKGVMPEGHPLYLGVSGLGGHPAVSEHMSLQKPDYVLVLGSRLGEPTSFWDRDLLPSKALLHVDIDPEVPGTAFPDFPTYAIHAETGQLLDDLLRSFPPRRNELEGESTAFEQPIPLPQKSRAPVRPQVVMSALQRKVVQGSEAVVLAECGNSFAWCNHYLRFPSAGRYRVSTLFGSMGHACTGVVGTALATGEKAVAVTGDGSMLMSSEISTAVQYGAQAVWVVLNDAGYGMCRDGHRALGLTGEQIDIPCVDFVLLARSQGADGRVVETEDQLEAAFDLAMQAQGPFVLDIRIDPSEPSPLLQRFESLIKQGNSKTVAGWDTTD